MWKDKQHPFRLDPVLKLSGIPTLIHWTRNGKGGQLSTELEQAGTPEAADALVADFISHNECATHSLPELFT